MSKLLVPNGEPADERRLCRSPQRGVGLQVQVAASTYRITFTRQGTGAPVTLSWFAVELPLGSTLERNVAVGGPLFHQTTVVDIVIP